MKARKILLAALLLAGVTATANAQGRGGPPPQRDSVMTQQQRDAVRKLREQQMKEMQDLRARHREQLDKILPPAARQQMALRQQRLLRESTCPTGRTQAITSPSTTATGRPTRSIVLSMRLVLPAPGDAMIFMATTPASSKSFLFSRAI